MPVFGEGLLTHIIVRVNVMIGPFGGAWEDQWPCGWQLGVGETKVKWIASLSRWRGDVSLLSCKRYSLFAAAEVESAYIYSYFFILFCFWHVFVWPPFLGEDSPSDYSFRCSSKFEKTSPRNKNDSWIQLVSGIALRQLRWISFHSWKKTTASKNTHILYSVIRFWRSIKKRFITFQQELGSLREVWLEKGIDTMKVLIFLDGRCVVCTPGKTYIDNRCIHTYIHTYIHAYIHTYMHACMHACMHADLQNIFLFYRILSVRI